jgi:hypothetical protein
MPPKRRAGHLTSSLSPLRRDATPPLEGPVTRLPKIKPDAYGKRKKKGGRQ